MGCGSSVDATRATTPPRSPDGLPKERRLKSIEPGCQPENSSESGHSVNDGTPEIQILQASSPAAPSGPAVSPPFSSATTSPSSSLKGSQRKGSATMSPQQSPPCAEIPDQQDLAHSNDAVLLSRDPDSLQHYQETTFGISDDDPYFQARTITVTSIQKNPFQSSIRRGSSMSTTEPFDRHIDSPNGKRVSFHVDGAPDSRTPEKSSLTAEASQRDHGLQ